MLAGIFLMVSSTSCTTNPEEPEPSATQGAQSPDLPDNEPNANGEAADWDDYGRLMVACLTEYGWSVTETVDGFSTPDGVPNEQYDQYRADVDRCSEDLGFADQPPPELSEQKAGELYDTFLEVADCVRALGHQVPEAPSRQAFVDDVVRTPVPPWHPYDAVYEAAVIDDLAEVEEQCPVS